MFKRWKMRGEELSHVRDPQAKSSLGKGSLDGQQGIDLARSERPDIILIDMSLPVIEGWEATRRLGR
jgi:CheY-like chemotaxis protein